MLYAHISILDDLLCGYDKWPQELNGDRCATHLMTNAAQLRVEVRR